MKHRILKRNTKKSMPNSSDVHVPTAGSEEEMPVPTEGGSPGDFAAGAANLEVEMIKSANEAGSNGSEERAESVDLITMPADVDGTKCANCKWVDGDFCTNPRVDQELKDGAEKMCCNLWDHPGTQHAGGVEKDTSPSQMGSNFMDGLYDMQQIVCGVDWELEHGNPDPDMAKEAALSNLADNPEYYKLKTLMANQSDDKLTKDTGENEDASVTNWPIGLDLDLCSGSCREPGHIGFDLYPYDHGTVVHDLTLGIPAKSGTAKSVRLFDGLEHLPEEDQKPLLSEIHRVLMPGGQFTYQGPNDIWNYPNWSEDFPGLILTNHEQDDDQVEKIEGLPTYRQTFTRIAVPDAATANDAEPRIGVAQYDMLPADALLAMDALGYSWSDATSSGRGNRLHGYPSQGSLLNRTEENSANRVGMEKGEHDPENMESLEESLMRFFEEEESEGVAKTLTEEDVRRDDVPASHTDFALPSDQRYPINDVNEAIAAISACSGRAEEENVKNAVYRKFPQLKGDTTQRPNSQSQSDDIKHIFSALLALGKMMSPVDKGNSLLGGLGPEEGNEGFKETQKSEVKKYFKERVVDIKKAVPMKQIVYCVVLTPEELDAQDDWMTEDDIEDAAHIFMQNSRQIGANHEQSIDAIPVESYIAPQDLRWNEGPYGPQVVKQGSWVIGIKVNDPGEWRKVLSGEYQGVSVGGFGLRL